MTRNYRFQIFFKSGPKNKIIFCDCHIENKCLATLSKSLILKAKSNLDRCIRMIFIRMTVYTNNCELIRCCGRSLSCCDVYAVYGVLIVSAKQRLLSYKILARITRSVSQKEKKILFRCI